MKVEKDLELEEERLNSLVTFYKDVVRYGDTNRFTVVDFVCPNCGGSAWALDCDSYIWGKCGSCCMEVAVPRIVD